ncbi:MAG: ABC transporter [Firmicutes bacterium HGW-Firmicutes-20]|jgi:iron(III) transport system ATP-binding protein|nr:ABC transporter ATP-binding protein [Erysipelotrichaceae bacterium]PKM63948.1 MAG: ABC transporter [Firmicutes bacterium HGW-Firmicutes-20]PKM86872.1 MAG: ABC transporter [Firmicutes bacterium HGW-Firmicutes-10]
MYLKLNDLSFQYDDQQLIHSFSCAIEKGSITAVLGSSGSGKSTLLRLISGLEKPIDGTMTLDQKIIFDHHHFMEAHLRQIGLVFQDYALFPHLTVRKNIEYGVRKSNVVRKKEIVDRLLRMVELTEDADKYPSQCSGGMQQRVAIARALANEPKLLLLDEPFSNLDQQLKERMRILMKQWFKEQGVTVIIVTHDQQDAAMLADQIIELGA